MTAETDLTLQNQHRAHTLTGPVPKAAAHRRAVRGDLAHVRYAGQVFVSHYAVPVARMVGAGGALLHSAGRTEAEVIAHLLAGEAFHLLDIAGGWGWGQQGEDGFVGYLPMSTLTAL